MAIYEAAPGANPTKMDDYHSHFESRRELVNKIVPASLNANVYISTDPPAMNHSEEDLERLNALFSTLNKKLKLET